MDDNRRRIRRFAVTVVLTVAGLGSVAGTTQVAQALTTPIHLDPAHRGCGHCWEHPVD